MATLSKKEQQFIQTVWDFYHKQGRNYLPWRQTTDPYHILVSELMLQQTQVDRVVPKYETFIARWPTAAALANVSLGEVLTAWQGLGYNRRAKYLFETAQVITNEHNSVFPNTEAELRALPGIGPYTASAILAFAFNQPVTLIETNVRQVYIHHFFPRTTVVDDKELSPLIERTVALDNPAQWYAALMDYGTHLKRQHGNITRRSRQYQKQSRFKGSDREVRGAILRNLAVKPVTVSALEKIIKDKRVPQQLEKLAAEGMVVQNGKVYSLPG